MFCWQSRLRDKDGEIVFKYLQAGIQIPYKTGIGIEYRFIEKASRSMSDRRTFFLVSATPPGSPCPF